MQAIFSYRVDIVGFFDQPKKELQFRESKVLPQYLGSDYCEAFAALRQGESDDFHSRVSNLDYEWYLRAL